MSVDPSDITNQKIRILEGYYPCPYAVNNKSCQYGLNCFESCDSYQEGLELQRSIRGEK